jgi:hypothetical protein
MEDHEITINTKTRPHKSYEGIQISQYSEAVMIETLALSEKTRAQLFQHP